MINVMIADDHALWRQGLKQIIELEEDMKVIYQASDGEEAYNMTKEVSPDIILMDINMPKINGIKAAKMLKNDNPKNKIMFLTIYNDKEYLMEALKIGVEGYILKDANSDELIKAIRTILSGGVYIHPSLVNEIENLDEEECKKELTEREMQILTLIAKGFSNKAIAEKLFLSEKTVKNHVYNIFRKLDVKDRTQAAIYLLKSNNMYNMHT